MPRTIHVSATMDRKLAERLDAFCRREERAKSWLIAKAVEEWLDEMEDIEIAYQRMADSHQVVISSRELKRRLHV